MSNIKLPDLDKLDAVKERMKDLPTQESAVDTSNWEGREITAPVVDVETGEYTVRYIDPMMATGMTDEQAIAIISNKKPSNIPKPKN